MSAEETAARNSLRACKGVLTRYCNSFEAKTATFKKNPEIKQNWSELEESYEKVKKSYDKVEDALTLVESLRESPEVDADLESTANLIFAQLESCSKDFSKLAEVHANTRLLTNSVEADEMRRELSELQKQFAEQSLQPGGGTTGTSKKTPKDVSSLKPELLTKSKKPEEVRGWMKEIRGWFTASNFDEYKVDSQMIYFRAAMDSEMKDRLDDALDHVTNLEEALKVVEDEFKKICPLLNRRVTLFSNKQPEGQSMSEYLVGQKQLWKEADVNKLTPEDLKATLIISSCTNKELATKLLELKPAVVDKPTVAELEKVIEEYEARKASEELLNPSKERSRRTDTSGPQCFSCREYGHIQSFCPKKKEKKREKKKPEEEKKKKKKTKNKVRSRRSVTPGVQGSGSETEGEEESPQEEHEDTTRRMVSTVKAASRRLLASCRQGAAQLLPNSSGLPEGHG